MTPARPGTGGPRPPAGRQANPRPGGGVGFQRPPGQFAPRDGGRPVAHRTQAGAARLRRGVVTPLGVRKVLLAEAPSGEGARRSGGHGADVGTWRS